jgi:ATP-dependent Lhr-like helicase
VRWPPPTRPTPTARRCPGRSAPTRRAAPGTVPDARPAPSSCSSTAPLVLYVERGGRTLLTFTDDPDRLKPAADALAGRAPRSLGRLTVETADGEQLLGSGSHPLREALQAAGFVATRRGSGLRLRA